MSETLGDVPRWYWLVAEELRRLRRCDLLDPSWRWRRPFPKGCGALFVAWVPGGVGERRCGADFGTFKLCARCRPKKDEAKALRFPAGEPMD